MNLHFEPNIEYQLHAIEAVCDIFHGQEVCRSEFTVTRDPADAQLRMGFGDAPAPLAHPGPRPLFQNRTMHKIDGDYLFSIFAILSSKHLSFPKMTAPRRSLSVPASHQNRHLLAPVN